MFSSLCVVEGGEREGGQRGREGREREERREGERRQGGEVGTGEREGGGSEGVTMRYNCVQIWKKHFEGGGELCLMRGQDQTAWWWNGDH